MLESWREKRMTKDYTNFLFSVGMLRQVPRSWQTFLHGYRPANVSEHTIRVAFISMIAAIEEGANPGRCVMMALCHDLLEVFTNDHNYIQRQCVTKHDPKALDFLTQDLPDNFKHYLLLLMKEFEEQKTLEARIVEEADLLDCDFEIEEIRSAGLEIASQFMIQRRSTIPYRVEACEDMLRKLETKKFSSFISNLLQKSRAYFKRMLS